MEDPMTIFKNSLNSGKRTENSTSPPRATVPKREMDVMDYRTDDSNGETQPGPVLLLTIHDAIYPINTKLIERLCSYAGPVLRIVIFRKKCVQASPTFIIQHRVRNPSDLKPFIRMPDGSIFKGRMDGWMAIRVHFSKISNFLNFSNFF